MQRLSFQARSMVKNRAFVADYDKRLRMFYDGFDLQCSIGRKKRKRLWIRKGIIRTVVSVEDVNVRARRV